MEYFTKISAKFLVNCLFVHVRDGHHINSNSLSVHRSQNVTESNIQLIHAIMLLVTIQKYQKTNGMYVCHFRAHYLNVPKPFCVTGLREPLNSS